MTLSKKDLRTVQWYRILGYIFSLLTLGMVYYRTRYYFFRRDYIILLRKLKTIPVNEFKLTNRKYFITDKSLRYLIHGNILIQLDPLNEEVHLHQENVLHTKEIVTTSFEISSYERRLQKEVYDHLYFIFEQKIKEQTI